MIGIYAIINLVNKKIYIGQSLNIARRWRDHKSKLNNGKHPNHHLQNAWNKYGAENFSFEILEECLEKELNEKEEFWLKKFGDADDFSNYNMKFAGCLRLGKESCEKISRTLKGTHPKTEWKKGEKKNWLSRPVLQYDLEGNFIAKYETATLAAAKLNLKNASTITMCCRGEILSTHSYQWKYEGDNKIVEKYIRKTKKGKKYPENSGCKNHKSRAVLQYDLEGNFIREWESMSLAGKSLNINSEAIRKNCEGINQTASNFQWKYKNSDKQISKYHNKHEKNVLQYDLDGNFIREWESIKEATNFINNGIGKDIGLCCNKHLKTAYGYIWKFKK